MLIARVIKTSKNISRVNEERKFYICLYINIFFNQVHAWEGNIAERHARRAFARLIQINFKKIKKLGFQINSFNCSTFRWNWPKSYNSVKFRLFKSTFRKNYFCHLIYWLSDNRIYRGEALLLKYKRGKCKKELKTSKAKKEKETGKD